MTDEKSTLSDSTLQTTEEWRDIPGYEGLYQVSDLGGIRRVIAMGRGGQHPAMGQLKPNRDRGGYRQVLLYRNKKVKSFLVHRLVTAVFIGQCPSGMEVNHKNGVRYDNRLVNLEYVTRSENIIHSIVVLGKSGRGEKNSNAILNDAKVKEIRILIASGTPLADIAQIFGVHQKTISDVVTGKSWKHIKD